VNGGFELPNGEFSNGNTGHSGQRRFRRSGNLLVGGDPGKIRAGARVMQSGKGQVGLIPPLKDAPRDAAGRRYFMELGTAWKFTVGVSNNS